MFPALNEILATKGLGIFWAGKAGLVPVYVLEGDSFTKVSQTNRNTNSLKPGAKKNNTKCIPMYRKWQGAIKCLHTKQCLQSNTHFPNHFT